MTHSNSWLLWVLLFWVTVAANRGGSDICFKKNWMLILCQCVMRSTCEMKSPWFVLFEFLSTCFIALSPDSFALFACTGCATDALRLQACSLFVDPEQGLDYSIWSCDTATQCKGQVWFEIFFAFIPACIIWSKSACWKRFSWYAGTEVLN